MIGMMLLTFILFFAFVVNIGMLVNAKINLQNAADMAAYSGAAVQARQLNQISFLNYEMRRQYKKFLFRYYVFGGLAQQSFQSSGGSGPRHWYPNNEDPSADYQVPAICIIFNAKDNFCQISPTRGLIAVSVPRASLLDNIQNVLRQQLQQIERLRKGNCASIGNTNVMLAQLWLYNTDPVFATMASSITDPAQAQLITLLRGIASGLGLVPKELLLQLRIDALAKLVNEPAYKDLRIGPAESMNGKPERERTYSAFKSALGTLGTHTFDAANVTMTELLPSGTDQILALKTIKTKFDVYAVDFAIMTPRGQIAADSPEAMSMDGDTSGKGTCLPKLVQLSLTAPIPVGVKKVPSVVTYYAVRLEADAETMYWPFGRTARLRAYAAATPFGSRIGPNYQELNDPHLVRAIAAPQFFMNTVSQTFPSPLGYVPNLPIQTTDEASNLGWNSNLVIRSMYSQLNVSAADTISPEQMNAAYQAAMAPNPSESGLYNILPPNPGTNGAAGFKDSFMRYFDGYETYAMTAPLFAAGSSSNAGDELRDRLTELFPDPPGASVVSLQNSRRLRESLQIGLTRYIQMLRQGQGEEGDGYNATRLTDAFTTRPLAPGAPFGMISLPPQIMMRDPAAVKTSWNSVNDDTYVGEGRVGYSVKFISFDSLSSKRVRSSLEGDGMSNLAPDQVDGVAQGDIVSGSFKH